MCKENKNNNFIQQFFSSSSRLQRRAAIVETVSWRMCALPHHVNSACAWSCCLHNTHMCQPVHALFTWTGGKHMRCDTLSTMAVPQCRRDEEEKNCWIKSLFLFSLCTKKYSRSFVNLRLNHWCHMDYLTNVLATFLCLYRGKTLAVYGGSERSRI